VTAAPDDARTGDAGLSFEAALEGLEQVVARLENGALGLEKALETFEEGVRLARECESRLDRAERRVEVLLRTPDGSLRAEPFEPPAPRGPARDGG
jgi:exodeoxyribonuclease VII small subunit